MMPGGGVGGVGLVGGQVVPQDGEGGEGEGSISGVRLDQNQANLEKLLFQATNPSNKVEDVNTIRSFCQSIDTVQDGAVLAGRLLSHKIQSPVETEALYALATVEAATKVSDSFVKEIGKFRFLNEMIKLVSPKYLGSRTPESVKQRVIELLYSWTVKFTQEKKIKEAYLALKDQGIIRSDPVHVTDAVCPAAVEPREADMSEEETRRLQKLLHSGNSQDLQRANKMIQEMVKKGEEKLAKAARQAAQLQEVEASCKLLSDMLDQLNLGPEAGPEDRELMSDLYKSCEKWRPKLFQLASEAEENDPIIGEILYTSDELSRIMDRYKNVVILNNTLRPASSTGLAGTTQQQADPLNTDLQTIFLHNTTSSNFTPGSNNTSSSQLSSMNKTSNSCHGLLDLGDERVSLGLNLDLGSGSRNIERSVNTSSASSDTTILDNLAGAGQSNTFLDTAAAAGQPSQPKSDSLLIGNQQPSSLLSELVPASAGGSSLMAASSAGSSLQLLSTSQVSTLNNVIEKGSVSDLLTDDSAMCPELPSLLPPGGGGVSSRTQLVKQQIRPKGLDELDEIGETAMLQNLPQSSAAAFTTRRQQSLPMMELIKKKEEENRIQINNENKIQIDNENNSQVMKEDRLQSKDSNMSEMMDTSHDSTETAQVSDNRLQQPHIDNTATEQSSKETISKDSSSKSREKVKLSDIKMEICDIVPHPTLAPIWLTETDSGEVAARLHPAENRPAPGVHVFVVSLINNSKHKVEDLDFKVAAPKGVKMRVISAGQDTIPVPTPFSPPPSINQILLVQTTEEEVSSKFLNFSFVLSYSINEEPSTVIGKDIQVQVS